MSKLWKLRQTENSDYETYCSCVVVADTEESAKEIHPDTYYKFDKKSQKFGFRAVEGDFFEDDTWATHTSKVQATYLGEASEELVAGSCVCSSYHAG